MDRSQILLQLWKGVIQNFTSDGTPVFPVTCSDGFFLDLVVCEYKSSVLRADAKLSGRRDLLMPEIDKKFVTGDDDGRKGVAQLNHSIARLLEGEQIAGGPARKWTQVLPVMICLEGACFAPGCRGI